jgi:hypothetical protein
MESNEKWEKNTHILFMHYMSKCEESPLSLNVDNRKEYAVKYGFSIEAFEKACNALLEYVRNPIMITKDGKPNYKKKYAYIKHYEKILPVLILQDEKVYQSALKDYNKLKK